MLIRFIIALLFLYSPWLAAHDSAIIQPYVLPDDHPIKSSLDKIFSSSHVLLNLKTMRKAGFIDPKPRKYTKLIVTKHPDLKGYVIKAYVDAQRYYKSRPEYEFWIQRIEGAEAIRQFIQERHLDHVFKVPKKWIYEVPCHSSLPQGYYPKISILVEEDMEIYSNKENRAQWKSARVTKELLDNVYLVLNELGLRDCAKPDNIPFSRDGKIAFIDTQTHHEWPVLYKKLTSYLSSDMKEYWKQLID